VPNGKKVPCELRQPRIYMWPHFNKIITNLYYYELVLTLEKAHRSCNAKKQVLILRVTSKALCALFNLSLGYIGMDIQNWFQGIIHNIKYQLGLSECSLMYKKVES
jgi:hypothetical protein